MPSFFRPCLAILAAALLITAEASALDAPLSDEAVREAYFLGQRHDDTTGRFLETYRRYFPVPESGPHVFVVELFTPYAQAVESSSKQGAGYSAQQARQDYQVRGDSLRVSVHIRYTGTHGAGLPYSQNTVRWKDFQVRLLLGGKPVKDRSVKYEGTLVGAGDGDARPTGFIIRQEYEVPNASDATIAIDSPDGQHVVASFDLSSLR